MDVPVGIDSIERKGTAEIRFVRSKLDFSIRSNFSSFVVQTIKIGRDSANEGSDESMQRSVIVREMNDLSAATRFQFFSV